MNKHVPFPRAQFRRRLRSFLKRNWKLLLLTAGIFCATGLPVSFMLDGYALGLLHCAIALGFVGALMLQFFATNRGSVGQLSGAWGEEMTTTQLKRARRKGHIWTWVDGLAIASGDIDHFVITKRGGLVAIDSKWRNDISVESVHTDARSAAEVRRRADLVLRSLRMPVGVTALVVVWGGAREEIPSNAHVDGVEFVRGDRLIDWLALLDHEPVDVTSANDLERRLLEHGRRVRPPLRQSQ